MTINDIYKQLPAPPKTLPIPNLGGRGAGLTLSRKGASGVNVGFGGQGNSFDLQDWELALVEARYDHLRASSHHLQTGLYGNPGWAPFPPRASYFRTPFIAAIVHYFRGISAVPLAGPMTVIDDNESLEDLDDLIEALSIEDLNDAKCRIEAEIERRRAMSRKAQSLQTSASDTPPLCEATCATPCSTITWLPCANSFWSRVWRSGPPSGALTHIWRLWVERALRATKGRSSPPIGGWSVGLAEVSAMSSRLYDFFISHWGTVAGMAPTQFLIEPWKLLLDGLNADASADPTLFWGSNSGPIYGRSQKLASLIGKYLMVEVLRSGRIAAFESYAKLLPVVVDRMGTLQHLHDEAKFRGFHRGSILRSWLYELQWDDYLTIQKAAKSLADLRCCKSPAIYELCHMW